MQFSVVIPAYQALEQLPRAIDGCLRQTLPPREILVVDDASPKLPAAPLREQYSNESADGRLKIITLPRNGGPSVARNAGWDAASGEFVAFLDADDCWLPDRLETVAGWLTADSAIDWIAHRYRLPGDLPPEKPTAAAPLSLSRLLMGNLAQTSCVALRRSIPLRFNPSMRHCEDYELWLRLAASGFRMHFAEAPLTELGRPQLSAGGLSGNRWAMRRGEMRAYCNVAALKPVLKPALPLLWAFSLAKHARRSWLESLQPKPR